MIPFKFFRGQKANLPSAKTDGQFYITTDQKKMYTDIGNDRIVLNPTYTANNGIKKEDNNFTINKTQLFNMIYPIGSIYTTIDKTFDPATEFGGTWSLVAADRVLWGTASSGTGAQNVDEQLPNIKGEYTLELTGDAGQNGVFKWTKNSGTRQPNYTGGNSWGKLNFDASRSNSIYKDNGHVIPNGYRVFFWQRTA